MGSEMCIRDRNNIVEGRFAGLGADGALHLMQDDGERHVITTGDVDLVG